MALNPNAEVSSNQPKTNAPPPPPLWQDPKNYIGGKPDWVSAEDWAALQPTLQKNKGKPSWMSQDVWNKLNQLQPQNPAMGQQPAAPTTPAPGAPGATPTTSPTGQPMFDPMAINAFYAQSIAPMMQQLQTNLGNQNALYTQMAQGIMDKNAQNLPPGFAQTMMGTIPQMGAAQNDVMASLMGAQLSGSAFDQLMNNINANKTAQEAAYRQLLSNPSLNSLQQAAGQLPGGVPAQGTAAPFTLPSATGATDPLVAAGVVPPPGSP